MAHINICGEFQERVQTRTLVPVHEPYVKDYAARKKRRRKPRLENYTSMIREIFGEEQARLYHQAVKAQRDPMLCTNFPGKEKLKLEIYSKKAGMARIKLNQADLRCPWILFHVLHKVGQDLLANSNTYIDWPLRLVDKQIIQSGGRGKTLPWNMIAERIRNYTGTDRLPRGMTESIRKAFVTIVNKQHHRMDRCGRGYCNGLRDYSKPSQPWIRSLRLDTLDRSSERGGRILSLLDQRLSERFRLRAEHQGFDNARVVVGGRGGTQLVEKYASLSVQLSRTDAISIRRHAPSGHVVDLHGRRLMLLSAQRWCAYSDLVYVEYLTTRWSGGPKVPRIAAGWAKPSSEAGQSDFLLVSTLDVAKEIENVRRKHGLISVSPHWLGMT